MLTQERLGYLGAYDTYLLQLPCLPSYLVKKSLSVRVEVSFHPIAPYIAAVPGDPEYIHN